MRTISDTITRLAALRARATAGAMAPANDRLVPLTSFGSNPGALRAHLYVPKVLARNPALVVVLHGCTQTAAGYDVGAGWSEMADRHGFVVLLPEQQRQNNPNLCFNWFAPADNRRDAGEALSIRQMISAVLADYPIDPSRVFVSGLSAGGAMTAVMLATYPEVFAGGAIIAGLPYGCANTVPEAFDRMRGHGMPDARALASVVRQASHHDGPWPTISIWHGSADATVNVSNAQAIVEQWRILHDVSPTPDRVENFLGHTRRAWSDAAGREVMEEYTITGMGHGTPLDTVSDEGCGTSGAYMLEANISSTLLICRFWDLTEKMPEAASQVEAEDNPVQPGRLEASTMLQKRPVDLGGAGHASPGSVRKVVEDALKAAGLMR